MFSEQVRARDGYICCVCGTDGNIAGDHLVPEKRRAPDQTQALLKRFHLTHIHDIANGLSLCPNCHYLRGRGAMWFNMDYSVTIDVGKLTPTGERSYREHLLLQENKVLRQPEDTEMRGRFPQSALTYRLEDEKN